MKPNQPDTDRLVHWLLSSLSLQTSIFHVGQYCGGRWKASTQGRARASFHLVLHGHCHLHRPGLEPIALGPRDGVFLLRDLPHQLSAGAEADPTLVSMPMRALDDGQTDSTGLACGFFDFTGPVSSLLMGSFPDVIVLRTSDAALGPAAALFDLVLDEARRGREDPSPLMARLVDLLFFYVIRHVAQQDEVAAGLWAVARRSEFASLLEQMLREPGQDWSIESMARQAHMSRASFCKHFVDTSGQPPAQFLVLLRMKIAAQRLQAGESIERAAEHVGYRSHAAFSRAFKKVMGTRPGAYRRSHRTVTTASGVGAMH